MARFAESNRTRLNLPFTDFGGTSNDYSDAAAGISLGALYNNQRRNRPDYASNFLTGMKNAATEDMAVQNAITNTFNTAIDAGTNIKIGEMQKDAAEEIASAQRSASKTAGIASGIGAIASAAIKLSDERVKNTIQDIADATTVLKNLRPVSFYYNDSHNEYDRNRKHYGFIAQEYQKVMPDATYTDDDSGYLCIDTMELIGLLVKSNQELAARVEKLENSK
tara:strand:+ start:674 stop:1339 length:666 start_codon:yes stop_codon:yes gene_type:complete